MPWHPRALSAAMAFAAGAMLTGVASSADAPTAIAVIKIEPRDGGVDIAASALAVTAGELRGEVVINRDGRSGTVSTRQSRDFELAAGETADIARTGISFGAGDLLDVKVTLTAGGAVVAESSVTTHGN